MRGCVILAFLLLALPAAADDLSGRAQLSFQHYDLGTAATDGFRQQYDLRLDKALTTTSLVRLFFRGDDFQGGSQYGAHNQNTSSRQLQPGGELLINTDTLQALAHSDYFTTSSEIASVRSTRTLERDTGRLTWQPLSLPRLELLAQRNVTRDDLAQIHLTDEMASAVVSYEWRGLLVHAEGRYTDSLDPTAGYERTSMMRGGYLTYAHTALGGKLTVGGEANAQLIRLDQRAVGAGPTEVPTPVAISRAFYGVDETPSDDSDHPLAPQPLLNDGNVDASSGISLGPESVSFQNLAMDIGRVDRVDEIRVIVRDPLGNPLRNGGGPVTWDVWTSQDGILWTAINSAQTSYDTALSLYSIRFNLTNARWFKAVSFGVNAEAAFVTEIQAYYHTLLGAGTSLNGNENIYNGSANLAWRPFNRLSVSYVGTYSSLRQDLVGIPLTTTSDLEHLGTIEYQILKPLAIRTQYLRRNIQSFAGRNDGGDGLTSYLDYVPTQRLRVTLEVGRQTDTLDGTPFTIETKAVHATAMFLRSLLATLDVGTQRQTLATDGSIANRQFINLTTNAQLLPSLRMLLTATVQRNTTDSTDPALQLLGPERDQRISDQFIWRPGRPLMVSATAGWVSGLALSGFTQRYHVEWYPFGDGTVSLGGSFDQDIDPAADRKATRTIFNPRWAMNRYVTFDVNYTSVRTVAQSFSNQQKLLYASVILSR